VSKVDLGPGGRSATLTLASPPRPKQPYFVSINGIKDASPARNTGQTYTGSFAAPSPVFTMDQVKPEQRGQPIRGVAGLPIKAKDSWTINVFVRAAKQPEDRTIIAGFGRCEQADGGNGRYLAKFPTGIHFWAHNRDVRTRTPLSLDQWQMLTATYDGTTIHLYKDGQKIADRAAELSDDQNEVNIAPKDPWDHTRQFDGEIRDLTIWNAALDDEAVKTLLPAKP
jgi:alpha-mannosidase